MARMARASTNPSLRPTACGPAKEKSPNPPIQSFGLPASLVPRFLLDLSCTARSTRIAWKARIQSRAWKTYAVHRHQLTRVLPKIGLEVKVPKKRTKRERSDSSATPDHPRDIADLAALVVSNLT